MQITAAGSTREQTLGVGQEMVTTQYQASSSGHQEERRGQTPLDAIYEFALCFLSHLEQMNTQFDSSKGRG